MPYKPSKPTGDSVSGAESALVNHPGGGVHMSPDSYNASRGLPKSQFMKTPASEVKRGIEMGTDKSAAAPAAPPSDRDTWVGKVKSQIDTARKFGAQVQSGIDLLGGNK